MDKNELDSMVAKAVGIKEGKITYTQIGFAADGTCIVGIQLELTPKQKAKMVDIMIDSLKEKLA